MDGRIKIDDTDLEWLYQYQPTLLYFEESGIKCLKGTLRVNALYNKSDRRLIINPSKNQVAKHQKYYVNDYYEVSVKFDSPSSYEIASVWEIGGKLVRVAKRKKAKLSDLHFNKNKDGRLCLHGFFNLNDCLPNGFNLKDFVSNILIPFFYSQSMFEKTNEWPLGQYLHADYGKFQNFLEKYGFPKLRNYLEKDDTKLKKFVNRLTRRNKNLRNRHSCICNSNDRIENCRCGFREIINSNDFKPFMKAFRKHFQLILEGKQSHVIKSNKISFMRSRFV